MPKDCNTTEQQRQPKIQAIFALNLRVEPLELCAHFTRGDNFVHRIAADQQWLGQNGKGRLRYNHTPLRDVSVHHYFIDIL